MARTRPGRPRKSGSRFASGDLHPIQIDDISPIKLRKLADAAMAKAIDPIWGTPLGLMHAGREISDSQFAAGREYFKRHAAWHRIIGAPPYTPRSASMMPGMGAHPPPDEGDPKAQEKARNRYERARQAVLAMPCGLGTLATVERICVEERQPTWAEKEWLKPALTTLAECFGYVRKAAA